MRALYAASLAVGLVMLIGWVTSRGLRRGALPQGRLPQVIAAAFAFGLGGLSASYAGGSPAMHVSASIVAAAVAVAWVTLVRERVGERRSDV